jgi:hypothetical protein
MTKKRRDGLEEMLAAAGSLLARASGEMEHDPNAEGLSRTVSYSLSLLNVAMSSLKPEGVRSERRYCTPLDVMQENERLQTLVLRAALQQNAA